MFKSWITIDNKKKLKIDQLCRIEIIFDWHDLYLQFMRYRYEIQTLYEYILSTRIDSFTTVLYCL